MTANKLGEQLGPRRKQMMKLVVGTRWPSGLIIRQIRLPTMNGGWSMLAGWPGWLIILEEVGSRQCRQADQKGGSKARARVSARPTATDKTIGGSATYDGQCMMIADMDGCFTLFCD